MYYKIINRKKRIVTAICDILGYAFWAPVNLFSRDKGPVSSTGIREILIIRTAYIGDVIMTLPILKPLKNLYPDARITFLTGRAAAELLKENPYIDDVLVYDAFWFHFTTIGRAFREYLGFLKVLRARRYDLVVEARGDIRDIALLAYASRSSFRVSYRVGGGGYLLTHVVSYNGLKHKVEYHLDIVRYLKGGIGKMDGYIYLTEDEVRRVSGIMEAHDIKVPFISVHPGGRLALKRWSVEGYAALLNRLDREYGMPIVLFGLEEERPLVDEIMLRTEHKPVAMAGKLSLREFAGMLAKSALFICNDSAPMHIAAAMNTPTVAIFGPSKSCETGPWGDRSRVVEKDFPCRFACDESACSHNVYHGCMTGITSEEVFRTVRELLN